VPRPSTGQVIPRDGKRGRTFGLRFRAYGARHYVTASATTRQEAEVELANILADVRRGIWRLPVAEQPEAPREEPDFHTFASEWYAGKAQEGLGERTLEDYKWALSYHLLPYFGAMRLSQITKRDVDAYKTLKASEGVLSANTTNKTLTRLAQILELAVEYELIPANPAAGRRRRLKGTTPRRPWVEPEQLMTLLDAADKPTPLLAGRGRPLLAVLAGAGLRIDEALSLQRRHVNTAKGTLEIARSKTDAGTRVVDLTPALRDELAVWLDRLPLKGPGDLVFPTLKGRKDNRQNIRRRLFVTAIERANKRLAELGIEPIGKVAPHGLRRTFAALRCVAGDDPAYTAQQIGHEDAAFRLRVYTHAVKRRERLSGAELREFNRALEWAQWAQVGTNGAIAVSPAPAVAEPENEETRHLQRAS
jgi:integrase